MSMSIRLCLKRISRCKKYVFLSIPQSSLSCKKQCDICILTLSTKDAWYIMYCVVQVREMAAVTLGGLLHCGYLTVDDDMMVSPMFEAPSSQRPLYYVNTLVIFLTQLVGVHLLCTCAKSDLSETNWTGLNSTTLNPTKSGSTRVCMLPHDLCDTILLISYQPK